MHVELLFIPFAYPSPLVLSQVYWPAAEENGERVVPTLAAMALYRHAVPTVVLAAGTERAGGEQGRAGWRRELRRTEQPV